MKSFLTMAIVFLMAGVFAPAIFYKQVSAQTVPLVTRNGDLITKEDGWQIPDISKLKIEYKRAKMRHVKNTPKIYITSYKTENIELPRMNYDGMADEERKVRIQNLRAYDIDKRIFCYRMLGWNVPLKGEVGVAVIFYITYYDLDGDGNFETWDIGDSTIEPLMMPDWVKK